LRELDAFDLEHGLGNLPQSIVRHFGRENLCEGPLFTGYTRDGGFATSTVADARFAFPLGETGADDALAPAGLHLRGLDVGKQEMGPGGDAGLTAQFSFGKGVNYRAGGGRDKQLLGIIGPG